MALTARRLKSFFLFPIALFAHFLSFLRSKKRKKGSENAQYRIPSLSRATSKRSEQISTPLDDNDQNTTERNIITVNPIERESVHSSCAIWADLNVDEKREVLHIEREHLLTLLRENIRSNCEDLRMDQLDRFANLIVDTYKDSLLRPIAELFVHTVEIEYRYNDINLLYLNRIETVLLAKSVTDLFEQNLLGWKTALIHSVKLWKMKRRLSSVWFMFCCFLNHSLLMFGQSVVFITVSWLSFAMIDYILSLRFHIFLIPYNISLLISQRHTNWFVNGMKVYFNWNLNYFITHFPAFKWLYMNFLSTSLWEIVYFLVFCVHFLRKPSISSFFATCVVFLGAYFFGIQIYLNYMLWLGMVLMAILYIVESCRIIKALISEIFFTIVRVRLLFSSKMIKLTFPTKIEIGMSLDEKRQLFYDLVKNYYLTLKLYRNELTEEEKLDIQQRAKLEKQKKEKAKVIENAEKKPIEVKAESCELKKTDQNQQQEPKSPETIVQKELTEKEKKEENERLRAALEQEKKEAEEEAIRSVRKRFEREERRRAQKEREREQKERSEEIEERNKQKEQKRKERNIKTNERKNEKIAKENENKVNQKTREETKVELIPPKTELNEKTLQDQQKTPKRKNKKKGKNTITDLSSDSEAVVQKTVSATSLSELKDIQSMNDFQSHKQSNLQSKNVIVNRKNSKTNKAISGNKHSVSEPKLSHQSTNDSSQPLKFKDSFHSSVSNASSPFSSLFSSPFDAYSPLFQSDDSLFRSLSVSSPFGPNSLQQNPLLDFSTPLFSSPKNSLPFSFDSKISHPLSGQFVPFSDPLSSLHQNTQNPPLSFQSPFQNHTNDLSMLLQSSMNDLSSPFSRPEQQLCVLCKTRARSSFLKPCGHVITCDICTSRITRCPSDNILIESVERALF